MADKVAALSSYLTLGGVNIAITKHTPKPTRECADDTDSTNYDAASGIVHTSQTPVKTSTELTVEGRFRLSTTMSAVVALAYSGAAAVPVVLGIATGVIFGHGLFDLTDFSADFTIGDIVTWSATLKSNGVFTPGS